ncbi:hypothetical protein QBC44DRAFT_381592 [Cladorrhinum sp. PSN332]|nr:hypothetical protein QBC44DRAFT_381592 [Cladorrhinum sp. PSN332]
MDLPEVVPEDVPEVYHNQPPHAEKQAVFPTLNDVSINSQSQTASSSPTTPWWRQHKVLLVILAVVVLIMGTIIGVLAAQVLIVSKQNSRLKLPPPPPPISTPTTGINANPSPTVPSTCRNTFCPSVISIVQDTTPLSPPNSKLFFALGRDSTIRTRRGDGTTWFTNWTSLPVPDSGLNPNMTHFLSQPSAVSYHSDTTVLSVDSNQNLLSLTLRKGTWDTEWINLRGGQHSPSLPVGGLSAPPTVCSTSEPGSGSGSGSGSSNSFDIWSRGTEGSLYHMHWNSTAAQYTSWMPETGFLSSAPFASCAPGSGRADVVLYGGYNNLPYTVFVKRWDGTTFKSEEFEEITTEVKFVGDPTAVSLGSRSGGISSSRTDYFGVGRDDLALYHFSWSEGMGYSPVRSLGGKLQSAPFALAVDGTAERVDVLVVGMDDRLKHKALVGSVWGTEWNDLGGSFSSAPSGFVTKEGRAVVYGLASNGSVFHASWTVESGYKWTEGSGWVMDGGNVTTKGFRQGMS